MRSPPTSAKFRGQRYKFILKQLLRTYFYNTLLTRIFRNAARACSTLSAGRRCCAAQILERSSSFALANYEISGLRICLHAARLVRLVKLQARIAILLFLLGLKQADGLQLHGRSLVKLLRLG